MTSRRLIDFSVDENAVCVWSNTSFSAADVLSAVQFDHTGEYLATGDRGGRVVIFRKNSSGRPKVRRTASTSGTCLTTLTYKTSGPVCWGMSYLHQHSLSGSCYCVPVDRKCTASPSRRLILVAKCDGQATTSFSRSFSPTKQSLTTWRVLRLKKKSTQLNGVQEQTVLCFSFPQTVSLLR